MPNTELPVKIDELTAFQRDCLRIIADEQPCKGIIIKSRLNDQYEKNINSSRTYPNLNQLTELGMVIKSERDGRTNEYNLSDKGRETVEIISSMWEDVQ